MISALSIRNILLIEVLDLAFQPGLNVLTGETGTGKSILLDSLGFVLGWRGKADIVRRGAEIGEVTVEFDLTADHPVHGILAAAGLPQNEGLILRRTSNRDGRKRAFVNDRACSGEVMRQLSEHLVEIHGQHDDKGLLDVKGHGVLLDNFADAGGMLMHVRNAWRKVSTAQKALQTAKETLIEATKDAEFLRHSVHELDDLAPEVGEDISLDKRRRLMQAAARIREDIAKAGAAISLDGAEGQLSDALRWLEDVAPQADGHLEKPLEALGRALSELADAQMGIEGALEHLNFNPSELEQLEERLFAIRGLARKHGVQPDALPDLVKDFHARLAQIDMGAAHIATLEKTVQETHEKYTEFAEKLSQKRRRAGARLDRAMGAELAPLKMERAVFITEISDADTPGPNGIDHVAFRVATNPGMPAGPINKIASGGELSRFLLALKVCLTARASGLTMIFDEIDSGVGGATADAVGRRLSVLADKGQVLVVTHSPQVAARGGHHWLVTKSVRKGNTITDVTPLDMAARTDELARMLAGDSITDEARAAAGVLLRGAGT